MSKKGNHKHLTLEQKIEIEKGLTENKSFAEIASGIGKDSSTISKEVRLHARIRERPDAGLYQPSLYQPENLQAGLPLRLAMRYFV